MPNKRIIAPHPRTLDEVTGVSFTPKAVDFVLINLERDTFGGLYLTLALAKFSDEPIVKAMYKSACAFWKRVDELMTAGDAASLDRARQMLDFPEPHELRLGYTEMGSYGSAVGEKLGEHVYDELLNRPELRLALTVEPDSISLIPGIAMDRSSDITATITKNELIEFTQQQMAFWKADPKCLAVTTVDNCWDPATEQRASVKKLVPVDDHGRVFLLVPKEICRNRPPMNPGQYFGPNKPKGTGGGTMKQQLLDDAEQNPGRLGGFVEERLRDPKRFKPRKDFRRD